MIKKTKLIVALALLFNFSFGQDQMLLKSDGKVVIGDATLITTPGNYSLYVEHGILTERVKVSLKNTSEWSDDAWDFRPDLDIVNESIQTKKHLVNIPSADELVKKGYELKHMDSKLLEQIEWIWMYIIELEEKNQALRNKVESLEKELKRKS